MSNSVRSPRRSYSIAGDAETLDFSQKYENYEDFVGAVQFWGYALVSGSADGAVRMWDSACDLRCRFMTKLLIDAAPCSAYGSTAQDTAWTHSSYNKLAVR